MFIVGLIAVFLLSKNRTIGIGFVGALIAAGYAILFNQSRANLTSPVLFDGQPSVSKSMSYIDTVHTATYSHVSDYFIGLLVAYLLERKIITGELFMVSVNQVKQYLHWKKPRNLFLHTLASIYHIFFDIIA